MNRSSIRTTLLAGVAATALAAQPAQQPKVAVQQPVVTLDQTPVFKVMVVSRTVKTVNYRHRSGATKIDFAGTSLMPGSKGEAKVESKKGYIEIEVEFSGITDAATKLGRENLTYVLWAISPEGRASNLGELLLDNLGRAKVNVTTELQAFGMIVTAEPYFAVSQPSDSVVLENIVRKDTLGKVEEMAASFELLERGQYPYRENESVLRLAASADRRKTPLEVWEARNALQIARWTGADKYAGDEHAKAQGLLTQAEDYLRRKQMKPAAMIARQAVQTAEDGRLIALKRMQAEALENERRAAADREAAERAKAAEAERAARAEAERALRAEQEREAARRASLAAEAESRLAAERAAKAEQDRQAALAAKQEADAARAAALEQQRQLALETEKAKAAMAEAQRLREAAEKERENLRQRLLTQLNAILQTTDSARGLIVNMSDVLFDTDRYTLRPPAREKLARVSGIVSAIPGLKLQVEGHTDSTGADAYNQTLSEKRAGAVREYLISQGIVSTDIESKGFGESTPVADNNTAAGRQRNRRVEIVVSGEAIAKQISEVKGQLDPTKP